MRFDLNSYCTSIDISGEQMILGCRGGSILDINLQSLKLNIQKLAISSSVSNNKKLSVPLCSPEGDNLFFGAVSNSIIMLNIQNKET